MSVNKVMLIGNLGRDPELRNSQSGNPICNLSVATSRKWTNKQTNEKIEETEWHRVTVFGQSAEHCSNYLSKGRSVYVEGRIHTSSYEDKDGIKKYSTEVIAERVQFLGGREDSGGQGGGQRNGGGGGGGGAYGGGGYQSGGGGQSGGQGGSQSSGRGGQGGPAPYDPGNYAPTGPDEDDIPF